MLPFGVLATRYPNAAGRYARSICWLSPIGLSAEEQGDWQHRINDIRSGRRHDGNFDKSAAHRHNRLFFLAKQSSATSGHRGSCAVGHAQLGENVTYVMVYRARAHLQLLGDRTIRHALRKQL